MNDRSILKTHRDFICAFAYIRSEHFGQTYVSNRCTGISPTPPKVSYLEIARVHRQLWRSDASDSCRSSPGAPLVEFAATQRTFGLLEPMSGIRRAI